VSITAQRPDASNAPVADAPSPSPRGHGRRLALFVGGLAIVTIVAALAWNLPRDAARAPSSADLTAYAPGGSVYSEQVPTTVVPWTSAYGPGSAVYGEQVRGTTVPPAWSMAYGPGSTVYGEQVPSTAKPSTSSYGPGTSTYTEQVPPTAAVPSEWSTAAGHGYVVWGGTVYPAAAGSLQSAYGAGSTTYGEQVPSARRP
jgi:hypothetical protein